MEDGTDYCRARTSGGVQHDDLQSSADQALQTELEAATENTSPPLQETNPSCSGVMILNGHDIVVQR